jgi:hypothetical protein
MSQPNDQTSPFVTVQFSYVDEFFEELKKNSDFIEPVMRVSKVFTRSQTLPIELVTLEACVLRDTPPIVQCIKLLRYCGEYMNGHKDPMADATMKRAEGFQKQVEAGAAELGLEVRAGIYK